MTEQVVHTDDEISLLDILVTLAESWKLLVFGPLVAAVMAGALSFLWPKTFESVAIVRLAETEVALISAAPVLDSLIDKFALLPEFDGNVDDARAYLAKKITVKFDKKTGLITITAAAATPQHAQEMSKAAIDTLLLELLPKGKSKNQIEQTILSNQRIIDNSTDALARLKKQIAQSVQSELSLDVVMKHYASLNAEVARKELENIELNKSLTVKGEEVFVQRPSLPQNKTSPKRSLVVMLAALASVFALLVFVFVREAWRSAAQGTEAAFKIARIKRLLGGEAPSTKYKV